MLLLITFSPKVCLQYEMNLPYICHTEDTCIGLFYIFQTKPHIPIWIHFAKQVTQAKTCYAFRISITMCCSEWLKLQKGVSLAETEHCFFEFSKTFHLRNGKQLINLKIKIINNNNNNAHLTLNKTPHLWKRIIVKEFDCI